MKQIPIQIHRYIGLYASAPTGVPTGSTLYDYATGIMYITYDGTNWAEKDTIVRLETSPSIDIGDVTLLAGTAAIGKLAANDGVDIGDVDIASITAGTNLIGKVGIDQATSNANEVVVKSITAGDNNIGNVDVASITAGDTVIGKVELVSADDSTVCDDSANAVNVLLRDAGGDDAIGDVGSSPGSTTLLGRLKAMADALPPSSVTVASDDTAGGATLYTGAAKLYWLIFTKETAAVGFCKILDGTSGSTGFLTIYCPAESSLPMTFNPPWQFDTGIRNGGMSAGSELVIGYVAD